MSSKIKAPYFPIIYVRGYAATMSEIEETVATPYMGFNLGSTKLRQGFDNEIHRFIFESPLLRLMKDEDYTDCYKDGDFLDREQVAPAKSIWIFRYYEKVSEDLGSGERDEIPGFARDLRVFIERIREQVCGADAEAEAEFKVYLVAHSMGGLVCRCYLQNHCPQNNLDPWVDKVFTYATPHNGIDFAGVNAPDLGRLDALHVRNFNRNTMKKYLKLPANSKRVDSLGGHFPPDRFFSFVGTNYKDYSAFFGLSKRATGPSSDGLVMMSNATVQGAPRAFAYRSHSGHYGIVNSEEGYQNLRRFLFGQVRVDVKLLVDEITLPPKVQDEKDDGHDIKARYNIDAAGKVRGGQVFLSERRVNQESAIRKKYEDIIGGQKPVYLFSGHLHRSAKTTRDTALAFAIEIAIEVPVYEIEHRFWFDEHFEGETLFDETIRIELRGSGEKATVKYGLRSETGIGTARRKAALSAPDNVGARTIEIPLGFKKGASNKPRPGFRGRLQVTARPWNVDVQ
ncbi:MAG: hypothetical protein O7D91_07395 [Planctomycetota bacterium]|nr:hypothetical protein [Planctomycetota bacterium]